MSLSCVDGSAVVTMYDMLKEFIKPEFVVLIPVLYLIGMGLKRSSAVFDRTIPLVLGAAGVVLCTVYVIATLTAFDWQSVILGAFTGIVQGILCAGASVYVNQIVKQNGKVE